MDNKCKQCGYPIVPVERRDRNYTAQRRGFCCHGCEEVYDAIKSVEIRKAKEERDQ